jgi:RNA polymerase sigma factor (sigma-70 family)
VDKLAVSLVAGMDRIGLLDFGELLRGPEGSGTVDDAAVVAAYEQVLKMARYFARDYGLDYSEAEDVTVDIVLSLVKSLPRGEIPNSRAYISSMVRNRMMHHLRRQHVEKGALLDLKRQEDSEASERAAHFADRFESDVKLRVEQAMSLLSDADRAVIFMRFMEDLTISEIAERLSMPANYVRARTFRALSKLRKIFQEQESDGPKT